MANGQLPNIPPSQMKAIAEASRRMAEFQNSPTLEAARQALANTDVISRAYADRARSLEAMQPRLNFIEFLQLPKFDFTAMNVMTDVMKQFEETQRWLLDSFQPSFDFASLTGITSIRPLVLPAIEEILAADAETQQKIYRDRVADENNASGETVSIDAAGDDETTRSVTLTVQQVWMLAWMMVLVMYLLALAGGGFNREELRTDIRGYAVTLMGALTFFGLFSQSRN